jgi:hypothetical protein
MLDPRKLRRDRRDFLLFLRRARKYATADLASMAFALGVTTLTLYYLLPTVMFVLGVVPLDTAMMLAAGAVVKALKRWRRAKHLRRCHRGGRASTCRRQRRNEPPPPDENS